MLATTVLTAVLAALGAVAAPAPCHHGGCGPTPSDSAPSTTPRPSGGNVDPSASGQPSNSASLSPEPPLPSYSGPPITDGMNSEHVVYWGEGKQYRLGVDGAVRDGAPVVVQKGGKPFKWVIPPGGQTGPFRVPNTELCADPGQYADLGNKLVLRPCRLSPARQYWGTRAGRIYNTDENTCFDVTDGRRPSPGSPTPVQMYACNWSSLNPNPNQIFSLANNDKWWG